MKHGCRNRHSRVVAKLLRIPQLSPWLTCSSQNFSIEILLDDLPEGAELIAKRELRLSDYVRGFAAARLRAMELITILNRCHRFRGFVYQHAHFSADKKSIEVAVRPRKGSAAVCSRCHLPAPGYDQLAERRFEFIPLWGFLVFLLYTMRRVDCRRCGVVAVEEVPWGDGKRTLTKAYMLFLARWARRLSWKETAEAFRTSWEPRGTQGQSARFPSRSRSSRRP